MTTIDDLSKTQVILLTLLVSFVTSIATGIITTSLLAEAPSTVTQTINRVVEHTIETVSPSTPSQPATVREVTIVREEDAILSSVDKATASVVRIQEKGPDGTDVFYSLGVVVSSDGLVIADKRSNLDSTYTANMPDGSELPLFVVNVNDANSLVLFKLVTPGKKTFAALTLAKSDPKLGQSIISFGGETKNTVTVGRVLSANTKSMDSAGATNAASVVSVDIDVSSSRETYGSPIVNLSGELVGLKTTTSDLLFPAGSYSTISVIRPVLEKVAQ